MTHRLLDRIAALAAACAALLWLAGCATPQQLGRYAGTYAASGSTALLVRAGADGRIDVLDPASGERLTGRAAFGSERGIVALLPDGRQIAIGPGRAGLDMSIDTRLYALSPVPPQRFDAALAAAAARPAQPAAAGPAGDGGVVLLGGQQLSAAEGSLGNYRDLYIYNFCSNGSFTYETMTTGSGVASQRSNGGSWQLAAGGQQLVLNFRTGGSQRHALRRVESNVVALGERKYIVERSKACR